MLHCIPRPPRAPEGPWARADHSSVHSEGEGEGEGEGMGESEGEGKGEGEGEGEGEGMGEGEAEAEGRLSLVFGCLVAFDCCMD